MRNAIDPVLINTRQPARQRAGLARLPRPMLRLLLAVACLATASVAWAQYKVVGPDGRVTYTDQPGGNVAGSRVSPMRLPGQNTAAADPAAGLPPALRQVVTRFPVTLYTGADCAPCERARALLRQRGIPHAERTANTSADGEALQRLTGERSVPTLTVGQQVLRGLSEADWQSTLTLAGYPAESALPPNWPATVAQPLVATTPLATATPAANRAPPPRPPNGNPANPGNPAPPTTLRF